MSNKHSAIANPDDNPNSNQPLENDKEFQFLHAHWDDDLPSITRADQVSKLVKRGFSQRSLARGLNVDEGTVRRDVEISQLPEEYKNRIRNGESVAAVLQEAAIHPITVLQEEKMNRQAWLESVREQARKQMQETIRLERMGAKALRLSEKTQS